MALKTLVKVGSITNLSDARYCAGMGVDLMGFRVNEDQPAAIQPKTYQDIRGWITGPQIVAEIYGVTTREQLDKVLESFQPDYLELSINEFQEIGSFINLPFILKIDSETDSLPDFVNRPAYLLTDGISGAASKLIPDYEFLLEVSSITALNDVLSKTGVSGIALTGGTEIRPGLKTYDELGDILEALETD